MKELAQDQIHNKVMRDIKPVLEMQLGRINVNVMKIKASSED